MPVLFTLYLSTSDDAEAERLASAIRQVPCDLHGEVPIRVQLESDSPGHRSMFITGCCPRLYTVVTEHVRLEGDPARDGTRGEPGEGARRRRRPTAI